MNPVTSHFEFMGPHLTGLVIVGLPLLTIALLSYCDATLQIPFDTDALLQTIKLIWQLQEDIAEIVCSEAMGKAFLCISLWLVFHSICYLVVPGRLVKGSILRNGKQLDYRINGWYTFLICCVCVAWTVFQYGLQPLVWIADHSLHLALSTIAIAFIASALLYCSSFRSAALHSTDKAVLLALGGNSGYPIYDFFIGRELNPRLFHSIDLKYMCELRPGLIGWIILNLAYAAKQCQQSSLSNSMVLVFVFQLYYVIDALWNEQAILTTMDITTDGFGFMLVFGDLVWVPFTYSLQSRFLVSNPVHLSDAWVATAIALNITGLWIFRSANGQKNAFRTNPADASVGHLKYLQTQSGSKLLVSGWWGAARKINYTGDWLMSLAWSLPCGFQSPIPYFYPFYFAVLLFHRAQRDEMLCRSKYGKDWLEYRKRVPYMFVPYVF